MHERIVHRHGAIPVATERLGQVLRNRGARGDRDVLDQVMREIAARRDREVEPRIAPECTHHMVEERNAGFDPRNARPLADADADLRLARLPVHGRHAENSCATARGSSAPVYSAMPSTTAATPHDSSDDSSPQVATPPAEITGKSVASTTSSIRKRSVPLSRPSRWTAVTSTPANGSSSS